MVVSPLRGQHYTTVSRQPLQSSSSASSRARQRRRSLSTGPCAVGGGREPSSAALRSKEAEEGGVMEMGRGVHQGGCGTFPRTMGQKWWTAKRGFGDTGDTADAKADAGHWGFLPEGGRLGNSSGQQRGTLGTPEYVGHKGFPPEDRRTGDTGGQQRRVLGRTGDIRVSPGGQGTWGCAGAHQSGGAHLGGSWKSWISMLRKGTKDRPQKGQVVLRLESSEVHPAITSSSYTSALQPWHREQLDSRTWTAAAAAPSDPAVKVGGGGHNRIGPTNSPPQQAAPAQLPHRPVAQRTWERQHCPPTCPTGPTRCPARQSSGGTRAISEDRQTDGQSQSLGRSQVPRRRWIRGAPVGAAGSQRGSGAAGPPHPAAQSPGVGRRLRQCRGGQQGARCWHPAGAGAACRGDSSCCSLAASPRRGVPPASPPLLTGPSSTRSLSSVAKLTSDRLPSAEPGGPHSRGGSGSRAAGRGGGRVVGGSSSPPRPPSPWVPPGKLRLPLFTSRGARGVSRRLRPAQVVCRCRVGRGAGGARPPVGGNKGAISGVTAAPPGHPLPLHPHLPGGAAAAAAAAAWRSRWRRGCRNWAAPSTTLRSLAQRRRPPCVPAGHLLSSTACKWDRGDGNETVSCRWGPSSPPSTCVSPEAHHLVVVAVGDGVGHDACTLHLQQHPHRQHRLPILPTELHQDAVADLGGGNHRQSGLAGGPSPPPASLPCPKCRLPRPAAPPSESPSCAGPRRLAGVPAAWRGQHGRGWAGRGTRAHSSAPAGTWPTCQAPRSTSGPRAGPPSSPGDEGRKRRELGEVGRQAASCTPLPCCPLPAEAWPTRYTIGPAHLLCPAWGRAAGGTAPGLAQLGHQWVPGGLQELGAQGGEPIIARGRGGAEAKLGGLRGRQGWGE